MKIVELEKYLKKVPNMIGKERSRQLYNFIKKTKPDQCLELGFAHGATSCYIAAALDEIKHGHLTSVDLIRGKEWQKPSIEELLSKAGLQKHVTVVREKSGYNWFLKKKIEENSKSFRCKPIYDFCFIDGSKNWTIDGFAFCLVDKLLKSDGWILFDDLSWSYAVHNKERKSTDGVMHSSMSQEELNIPHVKTIFELLVLQNPNYSEFYYDKGWWGWAHKIRFEKKRIYKTSPLKRSHKFVSDIINSF
ncbi:class I SAM-dependent methyltransferase [Candidatus Woesearchaeota archaeon]|nr:class I SAM-dependent methyltransferase [Candidatus Woesearchaeota archaeon]